MPGDPLSALEDSDSSFYITDPELRGRLLAYYGLDRPLRDQYVGYLKSIVRGDFGWSIARKVPVAKLIQEHLPWTLLLMFVALSLAALLSYVAGIEAAWRNPRLRRVGDHGDEARPQVVDVAGRIVGNDPDGFALKVMCLGVNEAALEKKKETASNSVFMVILPSPFSSLRMRSSIVLIVQTGLDGQWRLAG